MAAADVQGRSDRDLAEYFCDACTFDGKTKEALFFCPDCNDYMCDTCGNYHQKMKITRAHHLLSGENMPRKVSVTSPTEHGNEIDDGIDTYTLAEELSFWGNDSTPAEEFSSCDSISGPADELSMKQISTTAEGVVKKKKPRLRRVVLGETSTVNVKYSTDKYDPLITGLALLSNGDILLADYNNKCLKMLEQSQRIKDVLDLQGIPYDVSVINERDAVVTLPLQQYVIQFVRYSPRLMVLKTVKLNKGCWGVEVAKDSIFIACNNNTQKQEVVVMDLTGQIKRIIEISKISPQFHNLRHIAANHAGDKLYVTGTNQLMCMTVDGNVIYQRTDAKLGGPRGVVVDGEDNALVCCFDANKILTVKADGTKCKTLLKVSDGVKDPKTIGYRVSDGVLVVCGWKQSNLLAMFKLK